MTHEIRPGMEVRGADGVHIGTVDRIEGDRIRLTRRDSNDDTHHYLPLSSVTRVDTHVHVDTTAEAMSLLAVAGATAARADDGRAPFPPLRNRAVEGARPRGNFYLPWIVALVGLLLLFFLFRSCSEHAAAMRGEGGATRTGAAATAPLPVAAVTLPGGGSLQLRRGTLNYELQGFLASDAPTPRAFTFDTLNFDTGSAAIRPADVATIEALAQILSAYPRARVTIVGYTDARGRPPANDRLGERRADAVAAALAARGVDKARMRASSGGETNPADTNATAQGRFDNRRTELVVTGK